MEEWAKLGRRRRVVDRMVVEHCVLVREVVWYQCSLPRQWVLDRADGVDQVPWSRRQLELGCCGSSFFGRGRRRGELR